MIAGWILLALTVPVPFVFVVGFYFGKGHVRYLARTGGEESYPFTVQRVVEKYREERREHFQDGANHD